MAEREGFGEALAELRVFHTVNELFQPGGPGQFVAQHCGHKSQVFLARRGSPYQRYLVNGQLDALNVDLRNIITALSANIEMSTSEVLFTDRVSLPGNEVLFEMMSGSLGVATYWPMHAVTWEKTGGDVAILVEHASSTELVVQFYSFAATPSNIIARLWRLAPGEYSQQLIQGDAVLTDTKLLWRRNEPASADATTQQIAANE